MLEVTRIDWRARRPNRARVRIDSRSRPGIEVHHSVGIYGASSFDAFLRSVQADHLGRGWTDGFYNTAVWTDGTIGELRGLGYKSGPVSHLTICLAGNYDNRQISDEQKLSVSRIRQWLLAVNPTATDIAWHARRAAVSCPGRNVIPWLRAGMPLDNIEPEDDMAQHTAELASIGLNTKKAVEEARLQTEEARRSRRLQHALVADAVRTLRAEFGMDTDPESDELWAGWISEGTRTFEDCHQRFRDETS